MPGRKMAMCDCGMQMSAPKEQESALIDAIKYHAKTVHKMSPPSDDMIRKALKDA